MNKLKQVKELVEATHYFMMCRVDAYIEPFEVRACTLFSKVSKNRIIMFTKCSHYIKRLYTNFIFKLI